MSQNSKEDDHSQVPMDIEPETAHVKQSNVAQCENTATDLINILETGAFFLRINSKKNYVNYMIFFHNRKFTFI